MAGAAVGGDAAVVGAAVVDDSRNVGDISPSTTIIWIKLLRIILK